MEKVLQKIARQLSTLDEASLMGLWDKYNKIVKEFEPSKRWEEATLIFCMIQAVRWKNQLFNQKWASQQKFQESRKTPVPVEEKKNEEGQAEEGGWESQEPGKIIQFQPRKNNDE